MAGIIKGGQHDDRDILRLRISLHVAYNLVAAHFRQLDVADEQGWLNLPDVLVTRLSVHECFYMEIDRQLRLDLLQHVRIVFYHHHGNVVDGFRSHLLHDHVYLVLVDAVVVQRLLLDDILRLILAGIVWQGKAEAAASEIPGTLIGERTLVDFCHLMRRKETDAHTALGSIAVHEWLEEVSLSFRLDARTVVFYREEYDVVLQIEPYADDAPVRGIFHGVAQQVIDDGFHLFLVEEHLMPAGPRSETHADVLLLGYGIEIIVDASHETDDFALFHIQLHIARIDLAELHQLVDESLQSLGSSGEGIDIVLGSIAFSLGHHLFHGTLDDGERGAEFMRDMGEEVDTEVRHLFLQSNLLVQFEVSSP